MSTETSPADSPVAGETMEPVGLATGSVTTGKTARRLQSAWNVLRIVRVRFRFLGVLVVTALVVGQWERVTNWAHRAWDLLTPRLEVAEVVSSDTEYFCPMCPGVLSAWPDKCPVCFMPLVRRKKGEAMLLPEGVVARMQLSPQRISLAGVRTETVEYRDLQHEITSLGVVVPPPERLETSENPPDRREPTRLQVVTGLTPEEASVVAVGQAATIRRANVADSVWPARVVAVHADERAGPRAILEPTDEAADLWAGCVVRVVWQRSIAEGEPFRARATEGKLLAVPEGAVVDTGEEKFVFVETAPGMFDGVWVELGPRAGGYYPVLEGLQEGQRVASAGAFLLDAETRLSPHLRSAYFGSGSVADGSSTPDAVSEPERPKPAARKKPRTVRELLAKFEMTPEDRAAAEKQQVCPVTKMKLGSMGAPVRIQVNGKTVYLCCEGCRAQAEAEGEAEGESSQP